MKQIMRDMLFIMVATLYVVSTMGYGVHKCNAEGTASLILLFGETPCEYVHSHTDSNGNTYTHAHHPDDHSCSYGCTHQHDAAPQHEGENGHDGCCSTSVYVLTHDQNTNDSTQWDVPQPQLLASVMWDAGALELMDPFQMCVKDIEYGEPLLPQSVGLQAELCTFRI